MQRLGALGEEGGHEVEGARVGVRVRGEGEGEE